MKAISFICLIGIFILVILYFYQLTEKNEIKKLHEAYAYCEMRQAELYAARGSNKKQH